MMPEPTSPNRVAQDRGTGTVILCQLRLRPSTSRADVAVKRAAACLALSAPRAKGSRRIPGLRDRGTLEVVL